MGQSGLEKLEERLGMEALRREINYIIKYSDSMHKLDGQEMNVKKLCRKENIAYHGEDHCGFCFVCI